MNINYELKKRQKELEKRETRKFRQLKGITATQKIGVTLFVISTKQMGRKRGEHFETDQLTLDDWEKIQMVKVPARYENIYTYLRQRDNKPEDISKLWLVLKNQSHYREYTQARDALNTAFKQAGLPYRFRNIIVRHSDTGPLRARFIKVSLR